MSSKTHEVNKKQARKKRFVFLHIIYIVSMDLLNEDIINVMELMCVRWV